MQITHSDRRKINDYSGKGKAGLRGNISKGCKEDFRIDAYAHCLIIMIFPGGMCKSLPILYFIHASFSVCQL